MIEKQKLSRLYKSGLSMKEISDKIGCSVHKVDYWMQKRCVPKRSQSEAIYVKCNPDGDPFKIKKLKTEEDFKLFHLGIGLYLGEGCKKRKDGIRLANSDSKILRIFLKFLRDICGVKELKIKAELNIFDDVDLEKARNFWERNTGLSASQFAKPVIRKSKGGTYKNKSRYGTLTIYVLNTKLRDIMDKWCTEALSYFSNCEPR